MAFSVVVPRRFVRVAVQVSVRLAKEELIWNLTVLEATITLSRVEAGCIPGLVPVMLRVYVPGGVCPSIAETVIVAVAWPHAVTVTQVGLIIGLSKFPPV